MRSVGLGDCRKVMRFGKRAALQRQVVASWEPRTRGPLLWCRLALGSLAFLAIARAGDSALGRGTVEQSEVTREKAIETWSHGERRDNGVGAGSVTESLTGCPHTAIKRYGTA